MKFSTGLASDRRKRQRTQTALLDDALYLIVAGLNAAL